jgi:PAS domain S-box-containing protein
MCGKASLCRPHLADTVGGQSRRLLGPLKFSLTSLLTACGRYILVEAAMPTPPPTMQLVEEGFAQARMAWDIIHNLAFGVSVVDLRTGVITFANEAYAAISRTGETIGCSVFDLYAPHERARIVTLKEMADRKGAISYEADHLRKDGSVFPARVHVTSVRNDTGGSRYLIATVLDMSRAFFG